MTTGKSSGAGVIAVVFADAAQAHAARCTVRSLMHTHALCVEDMALASRDANGVVTVRGRRNLLFAGMVGGLAWGFVLGSLFLQPLLGVVAGLLCGTAIGALSVSGLDPAWIRDAAATMQPGESALVMAVAHPQDTDALNLVAGDSGVVVTAAEARPWKMEGGQVDGNTL